MNRAEQVQALREEFPQEVIGKLPRSGIHLDYVGHAAVTDRLLSVDPEWNWEPLSYGPDGQPVFVTNQAGGPIGLWIKLTVAGITRLGYGSCVAKPDAAKELIGDAIRNAAMRFGVALDLWSKDELESAVLADASGEKPKPRKSVDRARAAVARAKSVGDGELPGGAPVPDNPSATRRTQPEAAAAARKDGEPTPTPRGTDDHLVSGPGDAGDAPSPASLTPAAVMERFGSLNSTQRGLVRAEWAKAGITADEHPDECARVIAEVAP